MYQVYRYVDYVRCHEWTFDDVLVVDSNVLVAIGPRLLMLIAQNMKQLVTNNGRSLTHRSE